MSEIRRRIAANARRLRGYQHLTVAEAAARSGLSERTIRDIEAGRANPRIETLERLSAGIRVSLPLFFEQR